MINRILLSIFLNVNKYFETQLIRKLSSYPPFCLCLEHFGHGQPPLRDLHWLNGLVDSRRNESSGDVQNTRSRHSCISQSRRHGNMISPSHNGQQTDSSFSLISPGRMSPLFSGAVTSSTPLPSFFFNTKNMFIAPTWISCCMLLRIHLSNTADRWILR